jgi:hypothetical protein
VCACAQTLYAHNNLCSAGDRVESVREGVEKPNRKNVIRARIHFQVGGAFDVSSSSAPLSLHTCMRRRIVSAPLITQQENDVGIMGNLAINEYLDWREQTYVFMTQFLCQIKSKRQQIYAEILYLIFIYSLFINNQRRQWNVENLKTKTSHKR